MNADKMEQERGRFNGVFETLCIVWLFGNVIKFFMSFVKTFIGFYNGEYFLFVEPLLRLSLIVGFVFLLWKKSKIGFFIIVGVCILNLFLNLAFAGLGEMIGNLVSLALFVAAFFALKRDGKTAYDIVWGK